MTLVKARYFYHLFLVILLLPLAAHAQAPTLVSWQDTLSNSLGQVIPNATIIVLSGTIGGSQGVNATTQPGTPLATIYADPYGATPINQSMAPLSTSAGDGTFQFWALPGYYVVQAYGPQINGQITYGIAIGGVGASPVCAVSGGVAYENTSTNTLTCSPAFAWNSGTSTLTFQTQTPATSMANPSSPILNICGNYWTGSASAPDCFTLQNVTNVLTIGHSGLTNPALSWSGPISIGVINTPGISVGAAGVNTLTGGPITFAGGFGGDAQYVMGACEMGYGATTLSGSSTTTSLNCLPANSIILSVEYRITTTITTATSFTIGDSGSATRYCGTQSTLTAGTTGNCVAAGFYYNSGALGVLITPNMNPGAGAIRLMVTYLTLIPPTS